MLRLLSLTVLAVLAATGAAQAQVAAPMLAPLAFGTITANPATLQWAGYSFVGAALGRGDKTAEKGGAADPAEEGDFEVRLLQGRAVGEFFSAGFEFAKAEEHLGNSAVGSKDTEFSILRAGFAFRIGEQLALGLGIENLNLKDSASTVEADFSLPLAGVSVRLADVFFLGAAAGKENLEANVLPNEVDRNVIRYGVGLRTGDRKAGAEAARIQVHLEAWRETREAFELGPADKLFETESNGFVAELLWGAVLIGFHTSTVTEKELNAGVPEEDETRDAGIMLGWVPGQGLLLTLNLSREEREEKLPDPTASDERKSVTLGVGYVF